MTVETVTYISDLNASYPAAGDGKSEGDDHIRNLKAGIKATFPNVSGAVTPTHTELNYVDGVTSAIQTQLDAKGAITGQTWSGTHDFSAGTTRVATQTVGDSSTKAASTAFVAGTAFASALPAQTGNSGKFVTTDGTTASWTSLGLTYAARTSNTILGAADFATATRKFIDITSGTFTQTFDAAATIGANTFLYIRNSGTGDITLDPNGAETIDGLTSFIMYPGEARIIHCDGSVLRSQVLQPFTKTFTANGTFTKPPGYNYFDGILWGGGASGARNATASRATAGGGGGATPFHLASSALGATETVTLAAAAAGVTVDGNGNAGNNSTFGALVTAYGGGRGFSSSGALGSGGGGGGALGAGPSGANGSSVAGGEPAAAAGLSNPGFGGGGGASGAAGALAFYGGGGGGGGTFAGGASVWGGGGGGGAGAAGGTSTFGGSGGAGSAAGNGTDGTAPGGGGGATNTGTTSGAGARGELRIWGV